MNRNRWSFWFATVAIILAAFGLLYCFVGLKILPVSSDVLIDWESDLYGAIMLGWGTTLFLLGRLAFRRRDKELLLILLFGILLWLTVEAIFSFLLRVYFNVGVDIAVAFLFALTILKGIGHFGKQNSE